MHPIERLRYVARASGADQALLVHETAQALSAFHGDSAGLVAACRRVVDRHPTSGPLWWLCARTLCSPDPVREAWAAAEEIERDPTPAELAHALPDGATVVVIGWPELTAEALPRRGDVEVLAVDALGEGSGLVRRLQMAGVDAVDVQTAGLGAAVAAADLLVVEAVASGPSGVLAVSGSLAACAVARHHGLAVWGVAGAGRVLPGRLWDALVGRLDARPSDPWELDEEVVPLELLDQVWGPTGATVSADLPKRSDCPVAHELLVSSLAPGTFDRD